MLTLPSSYVLTRTVWITTEFVALHRFPAAASFFPERGYLEHPHRHKFFVRVEIEVSHNEREIEYHDLKDQVDGWIALGLLVNWNEEQSCETIAEKLLHFIIEGYPGYSRHSVSVSEDNENGSIVTSVTDNSRLD